MPSEVTRVGPEPWVGGKLKFHHVIFKKSFLVGSDFGKLAPGYKDTKVVGPFLLCRDWQADCRVQRKLFLRREVRRDKDSSRAVAEFSVSGDCHEPGSETRDSSQPSVRRIATLVVVTLPEAVRA